MVNAITGSEIVQVLGSDAKSHPAAATFPVTLRQIGGVGPGAPYSGTFVATGATAVTVANTNVLATTLIGISLNTVGGTPSTPVITTLTPGVGFTVTTGLGDTSTYNYGVFL